MLLGQPDHATALFYRSALASVLEAACGAIQLVVTAENWQAEPLLELLDHACSPEASPFPTALLPASCAPTATSCAYRTCVLDCACKWAALPSEEGTRGPT